LGTEAKNYQIIPGTGLITVRLIGAINSSHISGFETALQTHLVDPYPHVVVNCEHLSSLSKDWVRVLLKMQLDIKQYNKSMRLILVSPNLAAMLKREGVDSAFKYARNLRDAQVEFGLVTKRMLDTDFVNPFLSATLHVLKVQSGIESQSKKIYLKKADEKLQGDVSGIIGVVSDTFNGSVIISFPEKTFLNVMGKMLGEEFHELSQDIIDGAGEITNMIFGQAKIVLNEKGYGIKTAIPSVIAGKDHSLSALNKGPSIVVPFDSNAGEFFIEINLSG
jgi:chemotaxis protein CheX